VQPEPVSTATDSAARATDAESVRTLPTRRPRRYERLYRAHGGRMKSIAWNLLHNHEDAEDAVQETFLKVHRSIHTYSGQSAFSTWVYRILVNTCTDYQRSRKPQTEVPAESLVARARADAAPRPGARTGRSQRAAARRFPTGRGGRTHARRNCSHSKRRSRDVQGPAV